MLSGHVPSDKQDNERGEFQRADEFRLCRILAERSVVVISAVGRSARFHVFPLPLVLSLSISPNFKRHRKVLNFHLHRS